MSEIPLCIPAIEYIEMERPDLHFLWAGLLPHPGITVLEGEAKVGKSFLALQIAQAVARGAELGGRPCTRSRVVYLILEDEISWFKRLKEAHAIGFEMPEMLFVPHPFHPRKPIATNILEPITYNYLSAIRDSYDPDLVVIDPLRELHSSDEQCSTGMKTVGDAIMNIFFGRSILIVHHTKKFAKVDNQGHAIGPPNPITAGRGSSYIPGKASTIWLLWKEDDERPSGILRVVPRFAERETIQLEQGEAGLWTFEKSEPIPLSQLPPDLLQPKSLIVPITNPVSPNPAEETPDHSSNQPGEEDNKLIHYTSSPTQS